MGTWNKRTHDGGSVVLTDDMCPDCARNCSAAMCSEQRGLDEPCDCACHADHEEPDPWRRALRDPGDWNDFLDLARAFGD